MNAFRLAESFDAGAVAIGVIDPCGELASYGDIDRVSPLASVTKLLTALGVHVAVRSGLMTLDTPAGPEGSTIAHLLSHASGLSPSDPTRSMAPVGKRRIYSNVGFELAGDHLALAASVSVEHYLAQNIFDLLKMSSTTVPGSPAYGGLSSVADLLCLARELSNPCVFDPGTLEQMRTVAFPGLAGVVPGFGRHDPCDWGLGPELRSSKSPHWTGDLNSPQTFGHFGQSGSFLWIDPVAKVSMAFLSQRPFGPWAKQAWPRLSDAVLEEIAAPAST